MSSASPATTTPATESRAPLLLPRQGSDGRDSSSDLGSPTRPATLTMLLGRATGRRGPSMLVRETAARELDERRADWGYSKPVVALDMMWNTAFVVVSVVMLILARDERPNTPIRLWICGYALQCSVHVALVWLEYRRRTSRRGRAAPEVQQSSEAAAAANESDDEAVTDFGAPIRSRPLTTFLTDIYLHFAWHSLSKRCESVNTMASFVWWIVGFYWVVSGGDVLLQNAPHLYWLSVVFLAFDVFFAIFCVVLACLIGIALCCCLPCIIAILYAVAGQEGASEADLSILPKYKFRIAGEEKSSVGAGKMIPMETTGGYLAVERILLPEDAECCICLSQYEDGADLHTLPCDHHFHANCIVKWLKMNATCPLCKFNILKGSEQV